MGWPLKARRSLFPDWLWLCDESSPHRRALHIPNQILAEAAGNDFLQVWTNLCYRECFCKTNCWQEVHFEFSRQNLNRMCRALLCGDDSSHSQSQSGKRLLLASRGHPIRSPLYHGSCIDPTYQSHTLDPHRQPPIPHK